MFPLVKKWQRIFGLGFQHLPRDPANVYALKSCLIPLLSKLSMINIILLKILLKWGNPDSKEYSVCITYAYLTLTKPVNLM